MEILKLLRSYRLFSRSRTALSKRYCTSDRYNLNLQVNGVSLKKYVDTLREEYEASPSNDRKRELHSLVSSLERRTRLVGDITNLTELLTGADDEMRKLAAQEKEDFLEQLRAMDRQVLDLLIADVEEPQFDSLILEVQAGVGGQEAMLFAKEIFEMYENFCSYKGFTFEVAGRPTTDSGGVRAASALVEGPGSYALLRHEAGIHRVQRVPATERAGRVHTSAASVAVLPRPTDIEVRLDARELRVETKRASGAGGQHVNKTESAVRIVHLPTGLAVECQEDRSQIKNRKIAMAKLSALLYRNELESRTAQAREARKKQVKSRNRNEKIRTYNFRDDRITDHRIGANVYGLDQFMEGGEKLEGLIRQLDEHFKIRALLENVEEDGVVAEN